jgi:hypothetical protein
MPPPRPTGDLVQFYTVNESLGGKPSVSASREANREYLTVEDCRYWVQLYRVKLITPEGQPSGLKI